MISIIIPFKDKVNFLKDCIYSILKFESIYNDFEIILVDNRSRYKQTYQYLSSLSINRRIRILHYDKPFNFSAINNFTAKEAIGDYLLFLNNDIKVISVDWLERMLEFGARDDVGAVGARLMYSDGTIQHTGIIMGKNIATHAFCRMRENDMPRKYNIAREWSAVTAACMLTKKKVFETKGGFNETNLPIAYNDVDYCLRLRESGYKIFSVPEAKLYHYESKSRKSDSWAMILRPWRYRQFLSEQNYIKERWGKYIDHDPFFP